LLDQESGFDIEFEDLKKDFQMFRAQGFKSSIFETAKEEKDISLDIAALDKAHDRIFLQYDFHILHFIFIYNSKYRSFI
jgi:hypothetical protein